MLSRALPAPGARSLVAPASAAAALLAASGWLTDPAVGYLAACALATVVGVASVRRTAPRSLRLPLWVTFTALVVMLLAAGRAQMRLTRFSRAPAEVGATQSERQRALLESRVTEELEQLREAAHRALEIPAEPSAAVSLLEHAIHDVDHRALFVVRGDTLVSWAGTLHAEPRALVAPSGVVGTPFGLTLYAAVDSAGTRAVASALLQASPPADRLARGLAQRIASDEVTEGFTFSPPTDTATRDVLRFMDGGRPLFVARSIVPAVEEVRFRLLERARVRVGLALLLAMMAFVVCVARREAGSLALVGGVLVVLRCVTVVPLSAYSTRSRLFDAGIYFFPAGRVYAANGGALLLVSATLLLAVMLLVRRLGARLPRLAAIATCAALIGTGPFIVGALSRGITPPASGTGAALWLIWSIPLCLAATTLLVLGAWAGRVALGGRRGVNAAVGPTIALLAAILAPLVWQAPGQWPAWYSWLWMVAVAMLVLARPSRRAVLAAATVAGLASTTMVWGRTSRGRMELAEHDVRGLAAPDEYGVALAARLAADLEGDALPRTAQALLERYVLSDLSASGYPVALTAWSEGRPLATFGSAPFDVAFDTVGAVAAQAIAKQRRVSMITRANVYGVRVLAVPMRGGAVTILLAPRTRLIGNDAYARWYGLPPAEGAEPPYTVQVSGDSLAPHSTVRWRRDGPELHGDWAVRDAATAARVHVEVDLRGLDSLIPRGGLLVLANLAAVGLIWLLGAVADGRVGRWWRLRRRRLRSYRTRLSIALFLFFLVPASAFAVWSWRQLVEDAQASRRLLVTETMRAVSGVGEPQWLRRESARLDTKLLLYSSGVLVDASDSLFADLAPMGRLLRPDVALSLGVSEEVSATRGEHLPGATGMLGYRVLASTVGSNLVIAAPARVDDLLLDRRRRDLSVLLIFATALGAAAAFWLSAVAARQLARPIGALRAAARAVARGERELPLEDATASEFQPVFTAFRAMAADLGASRLALEEAQRRTDAVLRTVASGVVAVDERGAVILANPRAHELLGEVPPAGDAIGDLDVPTVAVRVMQFLASDEESDGFDLAREGRDLRGQLTRLARGGAVLTLEDVTELARAQRVLAWGEMARQVAHEIKNPLTPIRLGVQHLRRARGRPDFDAILDQNVTRILGEIDRLDEIARAFSRYGSAPEERLVAKPTDVAAIVQDVIALERLGEGEVEWQCRVEGGAAQALAREDELREVLLNLFENARLANARHVAALVSLEAGTSPGVSSGMVSIAVTDDGVGMSPEVLPRIFEPHFSTRTSGSGLGLAITRRMVESWGGTVSIDSVAGQGTTVRVELRAC